eukprot:scaffold843_cov77-Skeletonema_dohrnii-CCMP3373.AAC.2
MESSKEVSVDMGQRSKRQGMGQIKHNEEEFARGMEHIAIHRRLNQLKGYIDSAALVEQVVKDWNERQST